MDRIRRAVCPQTIVLAISGDTSDTINFSDFAGGMLYLPAEFDGTTLTWYVSYDGSNWFAATVDTGLGTAVTSTVAASKAVPIPPDLFGAPFIRFVVGTAQSTTVSTVYVTLKS